MKEPSLNSAMMPSENPIFLRRSGVRIIRAIALNTRPPFYLLTAEEWGTPMRGSPPILSAVVTGVTNTTLTFRVSTVTEPVSYTHLRAHETDSYLVCRLLLE